MLLHIRNIPICGLQVSSLTKLTGKRRVIHEALHLLCQRRWVTMGEKQAIVLMMHILGHPTTISSDHGDACLERLVDHQRRILYPDRWHDYRVTSIKHLQDNIRVTVFTQPLDTFS